jgi:hypothetical protein
MAYADGLLTSGERIVHREKQHWWVFVWGAKYTILAVIVAILLFVLQQNLAADGASGAFQQLLRWGSAIVFFAGLALLVWTTLRYLNQEYVLTNRRVIQVEGVVNKRAVDSSLEKINDAVLEQSVFGRMLDYGDLDILTANEQSVDRYRMLAHANTFKKTMLDEKHKLEQDVFQIPAPPLRAAPVEAAPVPAAPVPVPAAPAPDVPAPREMSSEEITGALGDLADLRDRGAISPEEYEAKKQDLLGRL